jgi:hypothetical protein
MSSDNKLFPLFSYIYDKAKELYMHLPLRRNGEHPFIHPINTVINLKRAKIDDGVTLCAGLFHDFFEESVDLYKTKKKLKEDRKGIKILDKYEQKVAKQFEEELTAFCKAKDIEGSAPKKIIAITRLLTRHKRDFYYRSIACIFNEQDNDLKEKAIQIKLADRTHNILCIEVFNEQERIYQCLKNIFIINNAKKYLLDTHGKEVITYKKFPYKIVLNSTERLLNKCCKATYDAFLTICKSEIMIQEVRSMLQLAFKKYAFEVQALGEVTKSNKKIIHPMRLYYGVMRKYDHRLHHEWKKFDKIQEEEIDYCKKLFSHLKLNKSQIKSIVDYKDAFSLKEIVGRLLYQPDYLTKGFLVSQLSWRGRIK